MKPINYRDAVIGYFLGAASVFIISGISKGLSNYESNILAEPQPAEVRVNLMPIDSFMLNPQKYVGADRPIDSDEAERRKDSIYDGSTVDFMYQER